MPAPTFLPQIRAHAFELPDCFSPPQKRSWHETRLYAPLQLWYKNTWLTFYTHPVLGGCLNNYTVGTSPDPLSVSKGLVCKTTWWCLFSLQHRLATSVGIIQYKAGCYVVKNHWVTSGTGLFIEWRKLTADRILAYWLFSSCFTP